MGKLYVEIEDSLLWEFKIFAANKHGRIYKVLKPEVEAALIEHMTARGP